MLAVFAHSAGLTGGEVAIAGGTAVINQKLLEALIGEAAVADIIRAAERDLRRTLRSALEADARRFLDLLAPPATARGAAAAADRVLAEAERLIASLGGERTVDRHRDLGAAWRRWSGWPRRPSGWGWTPGRRARPWPRPGPGSASRGRRSCAPWPAAPAPASRACSTPWPAGR